MKELTKYALKHGVNAVPYSGAVLVWDQDGCIAVKTLAQLKEWLGY